VMAGPFDQRSIESRADVLAYTSQPLTHDVEVTGPVEAFFCVVSSARDADFVVRLVDVWPDGRAMSLCEGIARWRGGEVRVDLRATSTVFRAGHRIQLDIASSSYPHYAINPH